MLADESGDEFVPGKTSEESQDDEDDIPRGVKKKGQPKKSKNANSKKKTSNANPIGPPAAKKPKLLSFTKVTDKQTVLQSQELITKY